MRTQQSLASYLDRALFHDDETYQHFLAQYARGIFTRDEESETHFCVHFLPYRKESKEVFIVHHKKAGSWIAPGGHIDKGETVFETLNRELKEEMGVKDFFAEEPQAFQCTTIAIDRPGIFCKRHLDIWFAVPLDGVELSVDQQEFHDTAWLSISEAKELVTDTNNIKALEYITKIIY